MINTHAVINDRVEDSNDYEGGDAALPSNQDVEADPTLDEAGPGDKDVEIDPSISDFQLQTGSSTFMSDRFPESEVVVNTTGQDLIKKSKDDSTASVSIAPGEGKIPTNIMRDNTWDINAFPNMFPTGRFGMKYE